MPANSATDPVVNAQTVTVSAASSSNASPYFITIAPVPGGSRTASVSIPAGYTLSGSTLCYNSTACHSTAPVPGASVSLVDDAINSGGGYCYADLWWHFCKQPSVPTNLTPLGAVCSGAGTLPVSWTAPAGGAAAYALRVNDISNGWVGDCSLPQNPGDICVDNLAATTYSVPVVAGRTYSVWVHGMDSCGGYGPAVSGSFTVAGAVPAPGTVTLTDVTNFLRVGWSNVVGETGYEVYRNVGGVYQLQAATPANVLTWTDPTPGLCGSPQVYGVVSVVSTNPVSCQRSPMTTASGNCYAYQDWFSAAGGSIVSGGGRVGTGIPINQAPPYTNPYFVDNAPMPLPGIASGVGGAWGTVTSANANVRQWLLSTPANSWSQLLSDRENSYLGLKDKVLAKVTSIQTVGGTLDQAGMSTAIAAAIASGRQITTPSGPVAVLGTSGSLTLTGDINLGAAKAVLLVDGSVTVRGRVNLTDNSGFLAVFAGGSISIDPLVGDLRTPVPPQPPLAPGVTYNFDIRIPGTTARADSTQADRQLRIEGSIIGMGQGVSRGVNLQRENEGPYPSEYVVFRPDQTAVLHQLGLRRKVTQELVNP